MGKDNLTDVLLWLLFVIFAFCFGIGFGAMSQEETVYKVHKSTYEKSCAECHKEPPHDNT